MSVCDVSLDQEVLLGFRVNRIDVHVEFEVVGV